MHFCLGGYGKTQWEKGADMNEGLTSSLYDLLGQGYLCVRTIIERLHLDSVTMAVYTFQILKPIFHFPQLAEVS